MTPTRRGRSKRGKGQSGRRPPSASTRLEDFWRAVPEPDVPERIAPAVDPTALLRSLGPPPLPGQAAAEQYLAAVIDRASSLAVALAAAGGVLAEDDED